MSSSPPHAVETQARSSEAKTSEKPTPAPAQGRETFIAAALAICDRHGPGAVTARNVAKEVRKSPMAVYRHFSSMDHLMATIWNTAYDQMHRETEEACRNLTHPAAALRQRLISFLDFGSAHPHLAWFIIATRPQPERFAMENLGQQGFAQLAALIRRGMDVGCFRKNIDPQQATLNASYLMIGMTSFVAAKAVSGATGLDQATMLENTVDWFLDDLKPRP